MNALLPCVMLQMIKKINKLEKSKCCVCFSGNYFSKLSNYLREMLSSRESVPRIVVTGTL